MEEFLNRLGESVSSEGIPANPAVLIEKAVDRQPSLIVKSNEHVQREDKISKVLSSYEVVRYLTQKLNDFIDDASELKLYEEIRSGWVRAEHLSGTISGKRGFCWVTKSQEVQSIVQQTSEGQRADKVRDNLGLKKYEEDIGLIEIKYPPYFCMEKRVVAPTVLDGGANPYFRPYPTKDGWGKTVDLHTLEDGLSEAVHLQCEINADFSLNTLGTTHASCPCIEFEKLFERAKERTKTVKKSYGLHS